MMAELEKKTETRGPVDEFARWFGDWPFSRWFETWRPELMTRLEAQLRLEEYREGNELVVRAEMPGLDPDKDVDIHVSDHTLRIHAERKQETTTQEKEGYRSEFRYGSFVRTLSLPSGASEADVKATYKDGILEVRIPVDTEKAAEAKVPVQRV